jgi:hypothetical protein
MLVSLDWRSPANRIDLRHPDRLWLAPFATLCLIRFLIESKLAMGQPPPVVSFLRILPT